MPRKLKTLARLSEPLKEVFKVAGLGLSSQVRTVNAVFPAMAKRRMSFWAWTSDEWVAISNKTDFRIGLLATAYFLADFRDFQQIGFFKKTVLARHIFGRQAVDQSIRIAIQEAVRVGHGKARTDHSWKTTLAELFLLNGSPYLNDLTTELISNYYANAKTESRRLDCWSLSYVLASLGHINEPIKNRKERKTPKDQSPTLNGVPQKWARSAIRWNDTSTLALSTRTTMYYSLLSVGRWLAVNLPRVTSPAQWDRALAAKAVAAVHQMKYGDYSPGVKMTAPDKVGSPLGFAAKAHYLNSLRTFFRDLQE